MRMYKLGLHVLLTFALFVWASVLFGSARNDPVLSVVDAVQLYYYGKAITNQDAANAVINAGNNVLGKDPNLCRDMTQWAFPTVIFANGGPNCTLTFTTAWSPNTAYNVNITGVNSSNAVKCNPGTYTLATSGGTKSASFTSPAQPPTLVIAGTSANPTFTLTQSNLGGGWAVADATGSHWALCVAERASVAAQINGNMSCAFEASQMCTCIYQYTAPLINLSARLPPYVPSLYVDANIDDIQSIATAGLKNCQQYRRNQDVRYPAAGGAQSLCQLLFIFAFTLFLNTLLAYWRGCCSAAPDGAMYWFVGPYAVLVFVVVLVGHLVDMASWRLFLIMWAPAMCLGFYADISFRLGAVTRHAFLHPFAFDVCLGCLTAYTLLRRGVVQTELVEVELWFVHGVSLLYMAAVWFFLYTYDTDAGSRARAIFSTVYVQESYVLAVAAGLGAAGISLVLPYPALASFEGHWLLPGAFTFVTFVHVCWLGFLSLRHSVQIKAGVTQTIDYFHDIGAFLIVLVGVCFLFVVLSMHMKVYGTNPANGVPFPVIQLPASGGMPSLAIPGFVRNVAAN